jgi:hypothetical protein
LQGPPLALFQPLLHYSLHELQAKLQFIARYNAKLSTVATASSAAANYNLNLPLFIQAFDFTQNLGLGTEIFNKLDVNNSNNLSAIELCLGLTLFTDFRVPGDTIHSAVLAKVEAIAAVTAFSAPNLISPGEFYLLFNLIIAAANKLTQESPAKISLPAVKAAAQHIFNEIIKVRNAVRGKASNSSKISTAETPIISVENIISWLYTQPKVFNILAQRENNVDSMARKGKLPQNSPKHLNSYLKPKKPAGRRSEPVQAAQTDPELHNKLANIAEISALQRQLAELQKKREILLRTKHKISQKAAASLVSPQNTGSSVFSSPRNFQVPPNFESKESEFSFNQDEIIENSETGGFSSETNGSTVDLLNMLQQQANEQSVAEFMTETQENVNNENNNAVLAEISTLQIFAPTDSADCSAAATPQLQPLDEIVANTIAAVQIDLENHKNPDDSRKDNSNGTINSISESKSHENHENHNENLEAAVAPVTPNSNKLKLLKEKHRKINLSPRLQQLPAETLSKHSAPPLESTCFPASVADPTLETVEISDSALNNTPLSPSKVPGDKLALLKAKKSFSSPRNSNLSPSMPSSAPVSTKKREDRPISRFLLKPGPQLPPKKRLSVFHRLQSEANQREKGELLAPGGGIPAEEEKLELNFRETVKEERDEEVQQVTIAKVEEESAAKEAVSSLLAGEQVKLAPEAVKSEAEQSQEKEIEAAVANLISNILAHSVEQMFSAAAPIIPSALVPERAVTVETASSARPVLVELASEAQLLSEEMSSHKEDLKFLMISSGEQPQSPPAAPQNERKTAQPEISGPAEAQPVLEAAPENDQEVKLVISELVRGMISRTLIRAEEQTQRAKICQSDESLAKLTVSPAKTVEIPQELNQAGANSENEVKELIANLIEKVVSDSVQQLVSLGIPSAAALIPQPSSAASAATEPTNHSKANPQHSSTKPKSDAQQPRAATGNFSANRAAALHHARALSTAALIIPEEEEFDVSALSMTQLKQHLDEIAARMHSRGHSRAVSTVINQAPLSPQPPAANCSIFTTLSAPQVPELSAGTAAPEISSPTRRQAAAEHLDNNLGLGKPPEERKAERLEGAERGEEPADAVELSAAELNLIESIFDNDSMEEVLNSAVSVADEDDYTSLDEQE